jgi:hypothetical protein
MVRPSSARVRWWMASQWQGIEEVVAAETF